MEYMCRAKPVVAFDLPETRFSAGHAATYACPNNEADFAVHIASLMDDPALRQSMGEIGYRRIRSELAWDYSVPNLLRAYQKLLNPQQPMSAITDSDTTTTPTSVHQTTEIHTEWKERESIWR
jgi:glycosyltransferase involved in cell wall biosynthesis